MWQRFTERARRVILLGQEEASKMNSIHVGTEHLLLGIVSEEGVAAQILIKMGVAPEQVRQEIMAAIVPNDERGHQESSLTPRAKRVLELAADEARRMKHNYIGTEHLLLALMREKDGSAAKVLRQLGLDLKKARHEVSNYLGPDDWVPKSTPETPHRLKPRKNAEEDTNWILRILPRLLPPELRELETTLRHLKSDVANAVAKEDYETAGLLHQRASYIELRIEEFVDKWEAAMQESTVPTPDFIAETITNLITQIETALNALQNNDTTRLDKVKVNLGKLKAQLETKEPEL
ncbi:MAG TPA: Clp protease N-terminal domain-containing protein [Abditibacteriaceae bacterium]|jgi:hypothetical protein